MKNKLSLYVALGMIASGAPLVSANTPVIYGKLNITLDQADYEGAARFAAGQAAAEVDQWELNSNSSRLGVKGELPLEGSSIKIVYQLEYEANADDGGASPLAQRNIFAGLQGNFGRVIGGKFDTPVKVAEGRVDQFNDLRGDLDYLIGGQNRADNIVQYSTPKLAELITLNAALITPEGTDVDQDGQADDGLADTYGVSVVAEKGNYYGAIAYEANQLARRGIDLRTTGSRADILRLVGTAKFGAIELGTLLQLASSVQDNNDGEDTSYLLSGGWNIGKTKLKAQYGLSDGDVSGEKGSLYALGVDYSLGSKTKIFTYYASQDVDQADLKDNTLALGFDHSF
jgi:hypothetical protein